MPNSDKKLNHDSSYFLTEFQGSVSIDGYEILIQNVLEISIRESIFDLVPILDLTILDNSVFFEQRPLQDNCVIKITLGSSNKKVSVVNMEFQLQDFQILNLNGDNINLIQVEMTAIMKNNNLFVPSQTRSFRSKSSIDVLKSISSESGFTSDVRTSTSDVMTWRQLNQNNYQMIYETMKRAFKSEDTILTGITRDKKFIITSLMTECKSSNTKKIVYDPLGAISLSNEKSKNKKDIIYFNNFESSNISGMVNKTIGYGLDYSVYDFNKVIEKNIISISHPLTKFSYKDKNNVGKIVDNGSMFFYNNLNMHKNYHDAIKQNEFFQSNFFTNPLIIHINPTEKINIFDKVDLTFPSFDGTGINQPQSGNYLCANIIHQASKEGMYRMTLVLFRNGFNSSSYIKDSEIKMAK